jgi:hypothetical protein
VDTKAKVNQLVAQTGVVSVINIDGENILRVVVEDAGPSNILQVSARLIGQDDFVLLKEITGLANEKINISSYEEVKLECTVLDALDVAIKVIASSFNEASGSAIQIDVPAGDQLTDIETLSLISSDNSITITGDNATKTINLQSTGAGSIPDASSSTKGILKLTGDLGGTADSPTVPGLASKYDASNPAGYITLAEVPSVNDATASTKGIVKLIGDLSGTADSPTVPALINKVNKSGDTMSGTLNMGQNAPLSIVLQDFYPDPLVPGTFVPIFLSVNGSENVGGGVSSDLFTGVVSKQMQALVLTGGLDYLGTIYTYDSIAGIITFDSSTTSVDFKINEIPQTISGGLSLNSIKFVENGNDPKDAVNKSQLDLKYDASNPAGYITLAEVPTSAVTSVNTKVGDVVLDKSDIGLSNVDNTSDADKPISTATSSALSGKQDSLGFTPEDVVNKSTDVLLGVSDVLYPTQKAVKTYVDATVSAGAPDASTTVKGLVKLAGDLGGTADSPTVPSLSNKVESALNLGSGQGIYDSKDQQTLQFKSLVAGSNVSLSSDANTITINSTGGGTAPVTSVNTKVGDVVLDKTDIGLSNVDNTSDADKPISTATATALSGKANTVHTHVATDVTDFSEAVDDRVNSLLVAGSNITLTYNDLANTLTIDAAGAPASTSAERLITTAFNATGSVVPKMTAIYLSGVQGDRPRIALAQANSEMTSSKTYGLVQTDIANMTDGIIVEQGRLENLNTDIVGWAEGDPLWLSPTVAGGITNVKPSAPNHAVFIGYLIRKHQNVGVIQVSIQNGYELQELHNVSINGIADAQVIAYENSTSLWKNKTLTKSDVGLSNVDNTSDLNKPISTATSTALSGKQDTLVSGTNIKTINGNSVLGSGDLVIGGGGSSLIIKDEGTQITAAVASINFTGSSVTASSDVNGNVTVDIQGGAGGAVSSVNGQVGDVILSTSWGDIGGTLALQTDLQSALDAKQNSLGFTAENISNKSTDTGLGTSDTLYPTQKAVKTYVDATVAAGVGVTSVNGQTGTVVLNLAAGVTSVNDQTGTVVLSKTDLGLSNVDNTSDADKPISTATSTALSNKVSKSGDTMTGTLEITPSSGNAATLNGTTLIDGLQIGHPYGAGFIFVQPPVTNSEDLYVASADKVSTPTVASKAVAIQTGFTSQANTGQIVITTGTPNTSGNSGPTRVYSGNANGGSSGYIDIISGTALNGTGGIFVASGIAISTSTAATTGQVIVLSGRNDSTTGGNTGGTIFGSGRILNASSSGSTGSTRLQTGNVPGSGNSGSIDIETGTVTSGTRGDIRLRANNTYISTTSNFGMLTVNDFGLNCIRGINIRNSSSTEQIFLSTLGSGYPEIVVNVTNNLGNFAMVKAGTSKGASSGGIGFQGSAVEGTVDGTFTAGDVFLESQSNSNYNDPASNLQISSGSVFVKTRDAFIKGTGTAANSGNIFIQTGNAAGTGTRGSVTIQAPELNMDNNKITRTSEFYFGDPNTDGTYRIRPSGSNLVTERRESGIWVVKQTITP